MFHFSKKSSSQEEGRLAPAEPPTEEALILICEKCGKNQGKHFARDIQQELKKTIRKESAKHQFRAVLTGCLDLCPEDEVAIGISRLKGENEFFTARGNAEEIAKAVWLAVSEV